jgi:hypothetical protein
MIDKLLAILLISTLFASMLIVNVPTMNANPSDIHVYPPSTISAAIAAASPGDTIYVHAGTYREEVLINKPLKVIGDGAATTTINGSGVALATAGLVKITANTGDVEFSGFTVCNATGVGSDNVMIEILSSSDLPGPTYTISHNNIYGSGDPDQMQDYGFYAQGGRENIVFTYNLVTGTGANNIVLEVHTGPTEISHCTLDAGVWGTDSIFFMTYGGVDVTTLQSVSYNTFDMGTGGPFDYDHRATGVSFCSPYPVLGTPPEAKFTNMVIHGNTFNNLKDYRRGIGSWNAGSGHNLLNVKITYNTITGTSSPPTGSFGIDFYGLTDGTVITGNTITGTEKAIVLRDGDAPGTMIRYNNIVGNTVGLDWTLGTTTVDAQFNWWGDATGPYHPILNPGGLGNPVTDNVDFQNYLTNPFETRIYTNPGSVTKTHSEIGSFFNVSFKIEDISDFFGFDLKITWDGTLIEFTDSYYSSSLNAMWGAGNWFVQQNATGGGGGGGAWYRLVALSTKDTFNTTGSQTLFTLRFLVLKGCNFLLETPIHFEVVKLSDNYWTPISAKVDDGLYQMQGQKPDLEFELVNPDSKPFEYCKTFKVEVYVTDICSTLKDYNLTILYNSELLNLTDVDWTGGVLGGTEDEAGYTKDPLGTVNVVDTGGLLTWTGNRGLLFTLIFHIEFNDDVGHIWRKYHQGPLAAWVTFGDAILSFEGGKTIPMSGITMPPQLNITINLIRGDVDCDGIVDVWDLRCVAAFYDKKDIVPTDPWYKYDLTEDGTIDIYDLVAVATNIA